jgi:hypothetical protein
VRVQVLAGGTLSSVPCSPPQCSHLVHVRRRSQHTQGAHTQAHTTAAERVSMHARENAHKSSRLRTAAPRNHRRKRRTVVAEMLQLVRGGPRAPPGPLRARAGCAGRRCCSSTHHIRSSGGPASCHASFQLQERQTLQEERSLAAAMSPGIPVPRPGAAAGERRRTATHHVFGPVLGHLCSFRPETCRFEHGAADDSSQRHSRGVHHASRACCRRNGSGRRSCYQAHQHRSARVRAAATHTSLHPRAQRLFPCLSARGVRRSGPRPAGTRSPSCRPRVALRGRHLTARSQSPRAERRGCQRKKNDWRTSLDNSRTAKTKRKTEVTHMHHQKMILCYGDVLTVPPRATHGSDLISPLCWWCECASGRVLRKEASLPPASV